MRCPAAQQCPRCARHRALPPSFAALCLFALGVAASDARAEVVSRSLTVAVVLVNFRDAPPLPAEMVGAARDAVFTATDSVNDFYLKQSYGLFSMQGIERGDGDVFGPVTIDYDAWPCSSAAWTLAVNAKVEVSAYDKVYYVAPNAACGWAGYAGYGAKSLWLTWPSQKHAAHELGHSLGLMHAGQYVCKGPDGYRTPIASPYECGHVEAGDSWDAMGSTYREMSALARIKLGWLDTFDGYYPTGISHNRSSAPIITSDGDFTLLPINAGGHGLRALRIPRSSASAGYDPAGPTYYYIEYRVPNGVFDNFNPGDPAVNGLTVRVAASPSQSSPPMLLDMTPGTPTHMDATLPVGQPFYDSVERFRLTLLAATESCAHVSIEWVYDFEAPQLSDVHAAVSSDQVTVTWSTSELADSTVEYGTSTSYGKTSTLGVFTGQHALDLAELSANTTYYYRVRSRDGGGNVTTSLGDSFVTAAAQSAGTPVILRHNVHVSKDLAVIRWTTDSASDTQVEYGRSTIYGGLSPQASDMVTSHTVQLSGLDQLTTYHYRLRSRNASGELGISPNYSFRTDTWRDTTVASIYDVVMSVTPTTAAIDWSTTLPAAGVVEYSIDGGAMQFSRLTRVGTRHHTLLANLIPDTKCSYRVIATDQNGNLVYGFTRSFTTEPLGRPGG